MIGGADAGLAEFHIELAFHYMNAADDLVDEDSMREREDLYSKSYKYFSLSADGNNPLGLWGVGYLNEHGLGVAQSATVAHRSYSTGAHLGDPSCMVEMGLVHLHGKFGNSKNRESALSCLRDGLQKYRENYPLVERSWLESVIKNTEEGIELDRQYQRQLIQDGIDRDVNEAMRRRFGVRG